MLNTVVVFSELVGCTYVNLSNCKYWHRLGYQRTHSTLDLTRVDEVGWVKSEYLPYNIALVNMFFRHGTLLPAHLQVTIKRRKQFWY